MPFTRPFALAAALFGLLVLGGCQTVNEVVSAVSGDPEIAEDEFGPARGPSLVLPPDYNLRPPATGGSQTASNVARNQVFTLPASRQAGVEGSGAVLVPGQPTPGEEAFLRKLGANSADPQIRRDVDQETQRIDETQATFTEKLLTWTDEPPPEGDRVAAAEDGAVVEREAVDEVPQVIIRKRRGLLDSIF